MVVSGTALLITTSSKNIQQDKISISQNQFEETPFKWRESVFTLEFAFDDGLEIERSILPNELPVHLMKKYEDLLPHYDKIYLEKVFKLGVEPDYEFYCFKRNTVSKFELK